MPRWVVLVVVLALACRADKPRAAEHHERVRSDPDHFTDARDRMVDDTIAARGVTDPRLLAALRLVPRHEFVPPEIEDEAYADRALPIGFGLTISQPFIVATMTAQAHIKPGMRVLEIGTGSGYQAAVLAELGAKVYSIEINEPLATRSRAVLARLGFDDIELRIGDGYFGWPEAAPFDAILVTTAAPRVPQPLIEQLAIGGHMVIPVGDLDQSLEVITRNADGVTADDLLAVRFSPMIGQVRRDR